MKLSRLTGKATIVANYQAANESGTVTATFNELKLDGTAATGSITYTQDFESGAVMSGYFGKRSEPANTISINGDSYKGSFESTLVGAGSEPNGVLGVVDGITEDGRKSFMASFGAKKTTQ